MIKIARTAAASRASGCSLRRLEQRGADAFTAMGVTWRSLPNGVFLGGSVLAKFLPPIGA
jgi:hypothetical protein